MLATVGAPLTAGTGMRKFVDTLTTNLTAGVVANLQIAGADTTTFPGSDFYVIALVQYTAQMHADLPPTTLRGYCHLLAPSYTACAPGQPSYLGPTILASKNKPVRVLFKTVVLGIQYGLGARSLAVRAGISLSEAYEILARLRARFHVFEAWRSCRNRASGFRGRIFASRSCTKGGSNFRAKC